MERIVLCAKNLASMSGVVSKASTGSFELIELRPCKNILRFLLLSIENEWRVIEGSVLLKLVSRVKLKVASLKFLYWVAKEVD